MQHMMTYREKLIYNYIAGYNEFDTAKMVADFDEEVEFENIEHGEVTISLKGLEAFKKQAAIAATYFTTRRQTIKSFKHRSEESEIAVDYLAVLATDSTNGMQAGEEVHLQGRSVFSFVGNTIVKLTDIS